MPLLTELVSNEDGFC